MASPFNDNTIFINKPFKYIVQIFFPYDIASQFVWNYAAPLAIKMEPAGKTIVEIIYGTDLSHKNKNSEKLSFSVPWDTVLCINKYISMHFKAIAAAGG